MKKILLSSLLLSSLVLADKIAIPMPASSLSVENSGILSAIDAYQDGIGIYTVQQVGGTPIDNSEMNELVYKYGSESKATGVEMKAYVSTYGSDSEKIKALSIGKFETMVSTVIADGTVCDDGNSLTSNDKYTNGVCYGTNVVTNNCLDVLNSGLSTGNGIYSINPNGISDSSSFNVYCDMTTNGGGWTLLDSKSSSLRITIRENQPNLDPNSTKGSYLPNYKWSNDPKLMCKSNFFTGSLDWVSFNVLSTRAKSYATQANAATGPGGTGDFSYDKLNGNTERGISSWVYVGDGRVGTVWIGSGAYPTCACSYGSTGASGLGGVSTTATCSTWVR